MSLWFCTWQFLVLLAPSCVFVVIVAYSCEPITMSRSGCFSPENPLVQLQELWYVGNIDHKIVTFAPSGTNTFLQCGHSWSHHSSFVGRGGVSVDSISLSTSHFGIFRPTIPMVFPLRHTLADHCGIRGPLEFPLRRVPSRFKVAPIPFVVLYAFLFLGIARRIAPRSIPSSLPSTTTSFLSVPSSVQNFLDCSGCWSLRQQPGAGLQLRGGLLASVKLFPDHGGRAVIVAPARRQVGTVATPVATLREGDAGGREQRV